MDKEQLFKPRLEERDVVLPGVGTVRIRALTRDEVAETRERHGYPDDVDLRAFEDDLVSQSMIDPVLTPAEVRMWAEASPAGELVRMADEIRDLSGLGEEAAKSGIRANRQQRRSAVRNGSGRKAR